MISLKDVSYVRLGSPDLELAETFATSCLGLQIAERGKKELYLRSDDRSHTLCYSEGDPADQTVGFEVEDEASLQQAASTLESLGHHVQAGSAEEAEQRKVRAFIGFRDPSGNHIELVVRPERNGRRYFAAATPASPASAISASTPPIPPAMNGFGRKYATRASATGSATFP